MEFDGDLPAETDQKDFCYQLIVDHLFISTGTVIAGFENKTYEVCLEIIVQGDPFSDTLDLDSGPRIGSKAITVFGGLDLHGQERRIMTGLAEDISRGDFIMKVYPSVDWVAGDVIAVAASGYMGGDSEVFTVKSVEANSIAVTQAFKYPHSGKLTAVILFSVLLTYSRTCAKDHLHKKTTCI